MKPSLLAAGWLLACGIVGAETSAVSPSGFVVTHRRTVDATPKQVFAAIGRIDRWWDGEHTYSGDAANLSLDLGAGGCFCERWSAGSIEHARVIYVGDDKIVRLQGGLGPLQELAATGVLDLAVKAVDGKTLLALTYRVSGAPDAALDKWAAAVDRVLGEQAARLHSFVETGRPTR
jgi:hypothetical protein